MARKPRIDPEQAWHHVMNRGARHQSIFRDDIDRKTFLSILQVIHDRFGVETQAYCLMGDHYHLLVHCPTPGLSDAMHLLGTVYTQKFNWRHDVDGALFRGRFHSLQILSDAYLLQASRYVHRNPLDLELDGELHEYPWSSYGIYLGLRSAPRWLGRSLVLTMMNNDAARYRRYVEADRSPSSAESALGALHADDKESSRLTRRSSPDMPTLDMIRMAVMMVTAVTPEQLNRSGRGHRNLARMATFLLAIEDSAATSAEIAEHYGASGRDGVWSIVRRARSRLANDAELATIVSGARSMMKRLDIDHAA